jgi:UDP-glucose 4-epimerase
MRVAVTGAAGFIGGHVDLELATRGHEIIPLDLHHGWDVKRDPLPDCDKVIHLAGVLGTSELFDSPYQAIMVNVCGTLHVLEECFDKGAGFVGITMPSCWANLYQATKRCAKDLATTWHVEYGVPVSHVRAFNAFGPGQKLGPVQKMVPTFAHNAWRGLPLPVWGDGTQQVDLIHVGDIARMLCDALDYGDDEVFDAGTGEGMSVLGVADMVRLITGSLSDLEFRPMRPGEQPAKVTADGDGWDLLGWRPEFRADEFAATVDSYR